jgi:hypothetical protein
VLTAELTRFAPGELAALDAVSDPIVLTVLAVGVADAHDVVLLDLLRRLPSAAFCSSGGRAAPIVTAEDPKNSVRT